MNIIKNKFNRIMQGLIGPGLKFCRELNEQYIEEYKKGQDLENNKYIYAYDYLKAKIDNDRNKLMQYKAEIGADDYMVGQNNVLGLLSFLVATLAFYISLVGTENKVHITFLKDCSEFEFIQIDSFWWFKVGALVVLLIFSVFSWAFLQYSKPLMTWRKYILVAIEELCNEDSLKKIKNKKVTKIYIKLNR